MIFHYVPKKVFWIYTGVRSSTGTSSILHGLFVMLGYSTCVPRFSPTRPYPMAKDAST